jgi:hypothetical protein
MRQHAALFPPQGAGIKVVAEKDGERLETATTGDGQFEFRVISPGAWKLNLEPLACFTTLDTTIRELL